MNLHDTGYYVKTVAGIRPAAQAAATVEGPAIDRMDFLSCVLHAFTGAVSGSPTSLTVNVKLQHSVDGATGWDDLTGAAIPQITAANSTAEKDIDLTMARRFIRAVSTVSFNGGTSPTVLTAASIVLGGARTRKA
jgi:hypothetical protein